MLFNFTMPKLSPTMESGVIAKWHKKPGDKVEAGEVVMEVSTDKAVVEHAALDEGFLRKIYVEEGGSASINQPVALFSTESNEPFSDVPVESVPQEKKEEASTVSPPSAPAPQAPMPQASQESQGRLLASPLAKKLAKEKGIDLSQVNGSGPRGRIIAKDLEKAGNAKEGVPMAVFPKESRFTEEPLSPMRQVISKRLQAAKQAIPHFYLSLDVNTEPLAGLKKRLEGINKKLSFNDLLIKACALALKAHPEANVGFNEGNGKIIKYSTVDVAVAVSLPQGLITPLIFSADLKSVFQIASEIRTLAERGKKGQLAPNEYQGGSFTLSNLGMYGIPQFQGIINPPQGSLLAAGVIREVPVVREGKVVPGKIMTLTLSVDHRLIDGAVAAQFINTIRNNLENPIALIV
jgi:pyruvate dehydrogenase E2 component (dihydrolipoamide acetyltransferase)